MWEPRDIQFCHVRHRLFIQIKDLMKQSGKRWNPLFILVPLRLGLRNFNIRYIPALKKCLSSRHCVGIMGGKPRHSLYFIGYQDKDLIGLDPHACRPTEDPMDLKTNLKTYHCTAPRKIPFTGIDPSLALGFYCETEEDLNNFFDFSVEHCGGPTPLYSIAD
eukprot:m.37728 g.37728  ORF g.37728 m.37728 type:complete len:162 (+) comp9343_c0_seq2:22-507(+)